MSVYTVSAVKEVDEDALLQIWNVCSENVIENQGHTTYEMMVKKFTEEGSLFLEGRIDGVIKGYTAGIVDVQKRQYLLTNTLVETPNLFVKLVAEPLHNVLNQADILSYKAMYVTANTPLMDAILNNFNRPDLYQHEEPVPLTTDLYTIVVNVL